MAGRFAALVVMVLAASAVATPVPKEPEIVLYFATTPGAKWVYERAGGVEEVVTITQVEKVKGELVVSRAAAGGNESAYLNVFVSAEGLRQRKSTDEDADPIWLLKTRVRSGDSWDVGDGKRTVNGPEEIEVPAGKFKALKVTWETDAGKFTSWYAPNVGELKRVVKRGDEKEVTTRLLKSFTAK
jgi:hypothetical protein